MAKAHCKGIILGLYGDYAGSLLRAPGLYARKLDPSSYELG